MFTYWWCTFLLLRYEIAFWLLAALVLVPRVWSEVFQPLLLLAAQHSFMYWSAEPMIGQDEREEIKMHIRKF